MARSCHVHVSLIQCLSCDFRWVTGPWEGCSQTCGNHGVQLRMIYCVRTSMVTSSSATNNSAAAIVPPDSVVEVNSEQEQSRNELSEARRLPEVTDDDADLETENPLSPRVDAWKPTIKDRKVRQNNLIAPYIISSLHESSLLIALDVPQKKLAVENEILTWNPNAITHPSFCKDEPPEDTQPCNRTPCPGTWIEKTWSKVNLQMDTL